MPIQASVLFLKGKSSSKDEISRDRFQLFGAKQILMVTGASVKGSHPSFMRV
jgi:hypothetical protein